MYTGTSAMSFLWGGISGEQIPAMLVKTVSQKACPVVSGVRSLDFRILLLALWFGGAMNKASFFVLYVTLSMLAGPSSPDAALMESWLAVLCSDCCLKSIGHWLIGRRGIRGLLEHTPPSSRRK